MTTTDRRDATDAQFADELARLDRLDVADVAADVREASPLAFAEWVVSLDDDDPSSPGRIDRRTVTLTQIVNHARAAIDALKPVPGTDTSGQAVQRDEGGCTTYGCVGAVLFRGTYNDGDTIARVTYCSACSEALAADGVFKPDAPSAVAGPQRDHDEEGGQ